jgi:hypothetical protein
MSCNNLSFFSFTEVCDKTPGATHPSLGLGDNPLSLSSFFQWASLDISLLEKAKPLWDRGISLSYLSSALSMPQSLLKLEKKIFDQDVTAITKQIFKVTKLGLEVIIGLEGLDLVSTSPKEKEAIYEFHLALMVSLAFIHLSHSNQKGFSCKKIAHFLLTSVPFAYEVLGPTAKELAVKTAVAGYSICSFLSKCKSKLI